MKNHDNDVIKDELPEETDQLEDIEIVDPEDLEKSSKDEALGEIGSELKRLETLLMESDERYLRLAAEYENYRKRTSKEKSSLYPQAVADTVGRFLPMLDSFVKSLEYESRSEEFAKGMELIYQGLQSTMDSLGVETFGQVGDPFDPALHNAVMHKEDPELGENVVSLVLQPGFKIGDRVLRHAVVETAN